jgi:hypothetical protein
LTGEGFELGIGVERRTPRYRIAGGKGQKVMDMLELTNGICVAALLTSVDQVPEMRLEALPECRDLLLLVRAGSERSLN